MSLEQLRVRISTMASTLILVYGRDQRLLETRSWVLQQAGFTVTTVMRLEEAELIVAAKPVRVAVLCHTLSREERVLALLAMGRLRPGIKRMVMTADSLVVPDEGQEETLSAFEGPRQLILAVERLAIPDDAPE